MTNAEPRCRHLLPNRKRCGAVATWVLVRSRGNKRYYCDEHMPVGKSQSETMAGESDGQWRELEHHARTDIKDRPEWAQHLSEINRGEAHPQAKLTEQQVLWVHKQIAKGLSMRSIARELGVSHVLISHINSGRRWPHLHPTRRRDRS